MSNLEWLRDRCADMLAEMWASPRMIYTRREMLEVLEVEEFAVLLAWLRPVNAERGRIIGKWYGGTSLSHLPDAVCTYHEDHQFAIRMTEWFDARKDEITPSQIAQRDAYSASTAKAWASLSERDKLFFGQEQPLLRDATDFPGLMLFRGKPVFELAVFGDFAWQRACILAIETKLERINEQLCL